MVIDPVRILLFSSHHGNQPILCHSDPTVIQRFCSDWGQWVIIIVSRCRLAECRVIGRLRFQNIKHKGVLSYGALTYSY